ncbi:Major royal jelly protein [Pseudomonas syringae pv. helianthi]|uniref:Major royal jelly protein n=1 Tax=Pseudomonas syringae pv. helianthi TaxID=251654 RepID=A0A3M4RGM5_9PSED|nr:L-dopachrome tautomerase-related protein [Pseudomonas syringae group genomosp. 7]RMR01849.1 Major royal jelly protein [Pseudomonas syringae pv. helianthi]RMV48309.1 Major royal jelly protein [Pseudomonas syringae pv. helianthi]
MHRKVKSAALTVITAATLTTSLAYGATITELPASAPADKPIGKLEQVHAFYDAMPTGVTVTETGRIFVNFPRWGDDVPFTVGEIRDGKVVAYPDPAVNKENPKDPGDGLISVQSVVADGKGRVWLLDTAAPGFASPRPGGAKLVAVDLATNRIVKRLIFPDSVILPGTYVNDMRFDFRKGSEGTVYVTDSSLSGPGAIIVMDIASGHAVRRLNGAQATSVDPAFVPVVEGVAVLRDGPNGTRKPVGVASDGIALSADGKTLYFSPLSSRHLYSVATELLNDSKVSEQQLAAAVQDLGEKGASDGLEADASGAVYAGDYEHNSIRKRLPDGTWQTVAHDPRMLWPDTLSIGPDGYLYFIVNQLHRQAGFNSGHDKREKPYSLLRLKIDAAPAPTH